MSRLVPARPGFYGWRLVAVLWLVLLVNLAFTLTGGIVINPYMAREMGFGREMLALPFAIYMVMTGLPAPLAALCVERKGIRFALVAGNLLLVAGAAAMASIVNSGWAAIVAYGVVVGTADALGGPLPAQCAVVNWFRRYRSLALAVILSAGGIGGFVAPPLLDWIIRAGNGNWRLGWWVVTGLAVVATAVSALFVRERPADLGQHPDGAATDEETAPEAARPRRTYLTHEDWRFGEALRSPVLWVLMVAALGFSCSITMMMGQGVVHIEDIGFTPAEAALALSGGAVAGLVANLAIGALGDFVEPKLLWAVCSLLAAVGMVMLIAPGNAVALYATMVILSIGGNGSMICMITLLGNYFGARAYGAVFGLASALQSTLSALAPVAAGALYDRTASYTLSFVIVAGMCCLGAILLVVSRPPRRPQTSVLAPAVG